MHQIPWPNRVRDGKYKMADGRSYEGLPINEPFPRHTSLHGLLYDRPMTMASYEDAAGDSTASVTFVHNLDGSVRPTTTTHNLAFADAGDGGVGRMRAIRSRLRWN